MADLTTLQTWLTEAERAYHALQTGAQTVKVQHGDMAQDYTPASTADLRRYIDELRGQVLALGGTVTGVQRRRGIVVYN